MKKKKKQKWWELPEKDFKRYLIRFSKYYKKRFAKCPHEKTRLLGGNIYECGKCCSLIFKTGDTPVEGKK